jgi:type II secretory pathway predicted ATPase ExeA/LysM repeat protein
MFLDFYQMHDEPFGVTPDPRFLYLGDSHREALASLYCGIKAARGFLVLIAPPGMGKTTLIFQLIQKLRPDTRTVFLFQTQCNSRELIQFLLNDLGVDVQGMETVAMHNKLNQILLQEKVAGRRFVLIIDEAQNLDPSVLETIRLLSNFETSQAKLLQILLVGQPQLARKLASSSLEQLQQRISTFAKVEPFSAEEGARYIAHRLKVAGYTGGGLFTSGAMEIIQDRSRGVPRNINRLCFSALSLGCAMGRRRIDADMMREVVADLGMESREEQYPHQLMLAPRVSSPAETADSPVISYPAPSNSRLPGWALGVACVAASIAIAVGLLSYSHGTIWRFLAGKTSVPAIIRNPSSSTQGSAQTAPVPSPVSSPIRKIVDAPPVTTAPPSPPSVDTQAPTDDEPKTVKVVVRPGETLQEIALRALGQDDSQILKQIQRLNPRLTNPDHIEADQEIRLPLISRASNPAPAAAANYLSRNN